MTLYRETREMTGSLAMAMARHFCWAVLLEKESILIHIAMPFHRAMLTSLTWQLVPSNTASPAGRKDQAQPCSNTEPKPGLEHFIRNNNRTYSASRAGLFTAFG